MDQQTHITEYDKVNAIILYLKEDLTVELDKEINKSIKDEELLMDFKNEGFENFNFAKTKLFINLSLLGNIRKLNEDEESIFFQLINDEQFIPIDINDNNTENKENNESKPIIIKLNKDKNNENSIFDFDYCLKNEDKEDSHEKKILDLVEYQYKIKTSLSKENIKLNSVKIYFISVNEDTTNTNDKKPNREVITREYNKEELNNFDLNKDLSIDLEHKLFMKYKKGKLYLTQVEFSLDKKDKIIYKIELPNDIDKMVFMTNLSKKVLNIKVTKEKFTVGVNQLNKFEIEVNKEEIDEVQVTQFKMNFISIPSYYKKTVPSTSMKALLNTKTNPSKASPSKQTNIQQQIFGLPNNSQNKKAQSRLSANNLNIKNLNPNPTDNQTSMRNFFYKSPNEKESIPQKNANNPNRSQMFSSSTLSYNQLPTPTPFTNIPSEKVQVSLPSPEFYFYNEENKSLDKTEKNYEKEYNDFESLLKNNKNKFNVLIKFLQAGQYEIKLNINYSIRHRDIEDYFEFNQEQTLKFIVIDPFKYANDVYSKNFTIITKTKEDKTEYKITEFLTDNTIQMNLILTNQLNEDIIIKDIIIEKDEEKLNEKNQNIEIKTPIKNIINSPTLPTEIKNQILKIMKTADYSIPIETKFNEQFQGSVGKLILKWSTPSLMDYECGDLSLENKNSLDLPYIYISKSELKYEYDTIINENKDVLFNIKVSNITNKCRKLHFVIENGDDINFIVSGLTKQIHSIRGNEIMNVVFRLIPLIHNVELKLPVIKITEINYNSQEKLCSYYYYPEKIFIN